MTYEKTKVFLEPTGNVFVDQAQITLKILLKYPNSRKISVGDIETLINSKDICGVDWIVQNLSRFKSFTMIFLNSPIVQSGFRPDNLRIAKALLESLIKGIVNEFNASLTPKPFLCDICGNNYDFNFDQEYRNVLRNNYSKYKADKEEKRFSTRDFFPLAGSMGSESQTFSNMTLPPNICPRCLFIIYYLPFCSQVIEGNLAIFQASNINEQTNFSRPIVKEYLDNISNLPGAKEIETVGKNNKSKTERIFLSMKNYFKSSLPDPQKITPQSFQDSFPKKNISFWLWKYSNSGQGPLLDVEVVPNTAIVFLYLCYALDFYSVLQDIISIEMKIIKYTPNQLYNSIRQRKLYRFDFLLKSNNFQLNPKILFLYYFYILQYSRSSIAAMVKIAQKILNENPDEDKRKQTLKKRGFFVINTVMRNLVEEGSISWEAFNSTFSINPNSPRAKLSRDVILQMITFKVIEENFEDFDNSLPDMMGSEQIKAWTEELTPNYDNDEKYILNLSADLFRYLDQKYQKQDFQKKVIDLHLKNDPESWFTIVYCRLIEVKRPISYAEYRYCLNLTGGWFNFRILLRTLFTFWNKGNVDWQPFVNERPSLPPSVIKKYRNPMVEEVLNFYFIYRKLKGLQNVQRKLISPFINGRISLNQVRLLIENFIDNNRESNFKVLQEGVEEYSKKDFKTLKNWDWEKSLVNPETGLQDQNYLLQFTKINLSQFLSVALNGIASREIVEEKEVVLELEEDIQDLNKKGHIGIPTEEESNVLKDEDEITSNIQTDIEEDEDKELDNQ